MNIEKTSNKVALITGGARRIGSYIAKTLHHAGYDIMIHYRNSEEEAHQLCTKLNVLRANSCARVDGDLADSNSYERIIQATIDTYGKLDALINNASTFYPTDIESITEEQWQEIISSNLKAPAFLCKYATPELRISHGSIINIIDIYAERPLADHPIYCSAKAGLQMLTKSLARDLAPEIRVNGVAPGAILWPETDPSVDAKQELLKRIPLNRLGDPSDIAKTIRFLLNDAPYISGQIIAVDGGRSVMP
jgi:pteridine reductase